MVRERVRYLRVTGVKLLRRYIQQLRPDYEFADEDSPTWGSRDQPEKMLQQDSLWQLREREVSKG